MRIFLESKLKKELKKITKAYQQRKTDNWAKFSPTGNTREEQQKATKLYNDTYIAYLRDLYDLITQAYIINLELEQKRNSKQGAL